jgi:23S rRNA (cytosine1962-C5)-methyltransferase
MAAGAVAPPPRTHGSVAIDGLTIELRATAEALGLFTSAAMLPWLRDRVTARNDMAESPAVLHLFAYTGLATLAMAATGGSVTHVDAARPTVAWARRNAELSGLADRPVRWIVDDAVAFTEREVRRGRRYAGVLDPPAPGAVREVALGGSSESGLSPPRHGGSSKARRVHPADAARPNSMRTGWPWR